MPRMKNCLIVSWLIFIVFPFQLMASNWAWVEKPVKPVQWDISYWPWFMTFDKNIGKLTLFMNDLDTGAVQVWTFSGDTWTKAWEGIPDMGDLSRRYYFRYIFNIYFDDNVNRIVIWAGCPGYQFETWCDALFKYEPGVGFIRITNCIEVDDYSTSFPPLTMTFDTARHRAVYVGAFRKFFADIGMSRFVTIEYDGSNIYYIPNPGTPPYDEIYFENGTSGYDPVSGHVVFYGMQDSGCPLQTWEYDGNTWTQLATAISPQILDPIIGMIHVPGLGGLLAVPNEFGPINSWLYRGHQWVQLQVDAQFDSNIFAVMALDLTRNAIIFYDVYANHMWELHCVGHCRPVIKP